MTILSPPPRARAGAVRVKRSAGDQIFSIGKKGSTSQDTDNVLQLVQKGGLTTNQLDDPFTKNSLYDNATLGHSLVPPPTNLNVLMRMVMDSSILRPCIEAMVVNIEGHGTRLEYVGPDGEDQSEDAKKEKTHIEALLKIIVSDMSLIELRKRSRWDMETLGFSFIEVGRSKAGRPIMLSHIPAQTMRVTKKTSDNVSVPYTFDVFGEKMTGKMNKRFRLFVQLSGTKKIWFKEYGDPRVISPSTGKEDKTLSLEDSATEIIMLKHYAPGQVYGLPRWHNNIVAIQGSRQAELTNLDYFKENAIPALAILVSGGALTSDTLEQIEEHVTAARGRSAQNRILVLEVEGSETAASRDGTIPAPRIDIKPLAGERSKEGQFLEYDKAQLEKVRSSFRLPPIFTGHSSDYTRASAQTSYEVAEGQVFAPDRDMMDDVINVQVLGPYGVKFWEVRSNPASITDPKEIIDAITAFDNAGAMTPNVAIGLANEQFGLAIPLITDAWGNYPFAIVASLAGSGRLTGFEDIMKELNEVDPSKTQVVEDDPVDPLADADADTKKSSPARLSKRKVRAALAGLRIVLEENAEQAAKALSNGAALNPPARVRAPVSK